MGGRKRWWGGGGQMGLRGWVRSRPSIIMCCISALQRLIIDEVETRIVRVYTLRSTICRIV